MQLKLDIVLQNMKWYLKFDINRRINLKSYISDGWKRYKVLNHYVVLVQGNPNQPYNRPR